MPYWHYDIGNNGWVAGTLMAISMLLLWGGFITVIVVLLRRSGKPSHYSYEAQNILNERFARGEIDQEEFERRKAILSR